MWIDLNRAAIRLERGQALKAMGTSGARVECESGWIWLTFDGDRRDIVLASGESARVERDTRFVVQGLPVAEMRICAPEPRPGFVAALRRRLARAVEDSAPGPRAAGAAA